MRPCDGDGGDDCGLDGTDYYDNDYCGLSPEDYDYGYNTHHQPRFEDYATGWEYNQQEKPQKTSLPPPLPEWDKNLSFFANLKRYFKWLGEDAE